jgi:hypothetical protein
VRLRLPSVDTPVVAEPVSGPATRIEVGMQSG